MSALLWPLFVAPCEAMTKEDGAMALDAFGGAERRQGMNKILWAWEVVQEFRNKAGSTEGEEVNGRIFCQQRGFKVVFG